MAWLFSPESAVIRTANKIGTVLLALVLAVIVWVVAVNQGDPSVQDVFPEPIPIEIRNQSPGTVFWGEVEDQVQVTIQAPRTSWDDLRTNSFQAWIDLEGLEPDIHNVDVQVKSSDPAARIVSKKPSKVAIRLESLKEKVLDVNVTVVDTAPLGYVYRSPSVTPRQVVVRGPGSVVDQVQSVDADIYLQGAKSDLERVVGLVPHDAQGESVGWVELDPPRVIVNVPIEQRIGYKDASVRVILDGQVAPGYRIADVSVEPSIVTVVGSPEALGDIGGYLETAAIEVNLAKSDVVERVTLDMPENVSLLGTQSVLVNVSVMPLEGGLNLQGLPLTWQGLAPDWEVRVSPEAVDVILSGPLPRLDPLTRNEVQVIVDVYGLEPGIHKIAPAVIVPEGITVKTVLPDIVEVEIVPKAMETPTMPIVPGSTSESTASIGILRQTVTPETAGSP